MGSLRITFLGTGTSFGVPVLGCDCAVCVSDDPRDVRLRPCALVEGGGARVLIDLPPDFRAQCLSHGVVGADAVLLTHCHADHIMGFDDLRMFHRLTRSPMPLHLRVADAAFIREHFAYAFGEARYPRQILPRVELRSAAVFRVGGLMVESVEVRHGPGEARGYVFQSEDGCRLAYVSDCDGVPESAAAVLRGVDLLVLDALRHRPHGSHFTLGEARAAAVALGARQVAFTHFSHDIGLHAEVEASLPGNMRLAHDGLAIEVGRG